MTRRCKHKPCTTELPPARQCITFLAKKGFCSDKCAAQWAIEDAQKRRDKERREYVRKGREKIKSKAEHARDAQTAFNAFIRERDKDLPCISCDTLSPGGDARGGLWDCSHYRSVGACPELRFEELNAHKGCKNCNRDKSGNIVEYRIRLKQRIGGKKLDWLEGPHEPKRYTIEDLKEIKALYRKKLRELKRL